MPRPRPPRGPQIQIPGQMPPGMMPQPTVVKISPCQVYLKKGEKLCFSPEMIKCIREVPGDGCLLYITGFEKPFELACSYDLFLERAGVNPQKIEETQPSDQ